MGNNHPLCQQNLPTKATEDPKKRNFVQITLGPDRTKLGKPRKVNVPKIPFIERRKFPTFTNTINYTGNLIDVNSKTGWNLTQEVMNAACSASSSLTPVCRNQLVNKNSQPPPPIHLQPLYRPKKILFHMHPIGKRMSWWVNNF